MKEIQYKFFSRNTHIKNQKLKRPNVCQFELTFRCGLRCRHCYSDCFNKPNFIRRELNTKEIKFILDKVYNAGVIWLCFTGGDPLARKDFLDIYSYAKNKGFLITIFTNGYSMNKKILNYLKEKPPFVLEITLNAVTNDVYEKISGVKGSFDKVMQGIKSIIGAKLPLKVKTQITSDNVNEFPRIKRFIKSLGLVFHPSYDLKACLNGDLTPCNLRIAPHKILSLNGIKKIPNDNCNLLLKTENHIPKDEIFRCAISGGDGININPYGNLFLCHSIRKPSFNLLKVNIEYALNKLLPLARNRKFNTNSKCRFCNLREFCHWCPGEAYLEKGLLEKPIEYYCELAKLESIVRKRGQ